MVTRALHRQVCRLILFRSGRRKSRKISQQDLAPKIFIEKQPILEQCLNDYCKTILQRSINKARSRGKIKRNGERDLAENSRSWFVSSNLNDNERERGRKGKGEGGVGEITRVYYNPTRSLNESSIFISLSLSLSNANVFILHSVLKHPRVYIDSLSKKREKKKESSIILARLRFHTARYRSTYIDRGYAYMWVYILCVEFEIWSVQIRKWKNSII